MTLDRPLRVAVVGAGPSGIFAADILSRADTPTSIDLLERLPAPFGLVRYGVAPDHTRIKQITNALAGILERGDIRLLANVTVGADLTLADLRAHYDAIVVTTGAVHDAPLNVPGAHLQGSFGSAEFVSWYDGHPDAPRDWPLGARQVAVLGVGNVALDIARMLTKRPEDLEWTDIPDNVREGFRASKATEIHIFGRRGPTQVKFSPLELREMGELPGVDVVMHDEYGEFDETSSEESEGRHQGKQVLATLREWVTREPTGATRQIHFHLLQRPVAILDDGEGRVGGIQVERMRPTSDGAVEGTGEFIDYPVQAVYRAIGYHGKAVMGLPFDEARGVIRNVGGRVVDEADTPVLGFYTAGWIKRGPSGLIGSNKSDAQDTAERVLEDAAALVKANAAHPEALDPDAVTGLLNSRGVPVIQWQDWEVLDAHERALGEARGRTRVKIASRDEMVDIALRRS